LPQDSPKLISYWLLVVIIAACVLIEATLQAAGYGLLGDARLRSRAYEYFGFWSGLLGSWQANYPSQPYVMFATYAFFHAGFWHLAFNMITLWAVGRAVIDRVGPLGFAVLYVGATLGGAAGYAFLGTHLAPMVGASGAIFGLVGGLLAWNYVDRYTFSEGLWPVARALVLLALMNLVLWWAMRGQLAWETHLGGFVFGWVLALLIDPRGRPEEDAAEG